jgi:hypothetical protein
MTPMIMMIPETMTREDTRRRSGADAKDRSGVMLRRTSLGTRVPQKRIKCKQG